MRKLFKCKKKICFFDFEQLKRQINIKKNSIIILKTKNIDKTIVSLTQNFKKYVNKLVKYNKYYYLVFGDYIFFRKGFNILILDINIKIRYMPFFFMFLDVNRLKILRLKTKSAKGIAKIYVELFSYFNDIDCNKCC